VMAHLGLDHCWAHAVSQGDVITKYMMKI
jgi:hypothetical protein